MIGLHALAAGFAADLRDTLIETGADTDLRDVLPFVELVSDDAVARIRVATAVVTGELHLDPFATEQIVGRHRVVALPPRAVMALARLDDLALPALYRAVAERREDSIVTPQLAAEIRGLVILCRCATTNGWVVWGIARSDAQRVRT